MIIDNINTVRGSFQHLNAGLLGLLNSFIIFEILKSFTERSGIEKGIKSAMLHSSFSCLLKTVKNFDVNS